MLKSFHHTSQEVFRYFDNHNFKPLFSKFQAYLYTNPLGEIAAKSGVVINRIHFSPTDHIIAFSGMVSGQGKLSVQPQFTAPVYVYKNKVTRVSLGELK